MAVNFDPNSYSIYSSSKIKAKEIDNNLGKDAFMQILVTQLKNQDPINPSDNDGFIAQMTQFSMLEQLTNMNQKIEDLTKFMRELKDKEVNENGQ